MATFTIELRAVIALIGEENIGLNDYPIFYEGYRKTLNRRIIDHYWYNEIAHETIDVFVRQVRTKMFELMPVMNEMYKSQRLEVNPLATQDIRTTQTSDNDSTSTTKSTSTNKDNVVAGTSSASKTRSVNADTPQTRLSGQEDYATSATDATADQSGSSTTDSTSNGQGSQEAASQGRSTGESRSVGYAGMSPGDLLTSYRESIINVDLMVIDELAPLFMGLWNNGDTYTNGGYYGLY